MIGRRNFLGGLAGILAAGSAPAIIHDAMKIYVPKRNLLLEQGWSWPIPHPVLNARPAQFSSGIVDVSSNERGLTSSIIHIDDVAAWTDAAVQELGEGAVFGDVREKCVEKYGVTVANFMQNWNRQSKWAAA